MPDLGSGCCVIRRRSRILHDGHAVGSRGFGFTDAKNVDTDNTVVHCNACHQDSSLDEVQLSRFLSGDEEVAARLVPPFPSLEAAWVPSAWRVIGTRGPVGAT